MKKQLVLMVLMVVLCFSCTAFFEFDEQNVYHLDKDGKVIKDGDGGDFVSNTKVIFNNVANNYKVDIFSTHSRNNKIVTVNSGQRSSPISWFANDSYPFYLTYYLNIAGIEIQYIPSQYQVDAVVANIIKDIDNEITVRNLDMIIPTDVALFDEAYLTIKNSYDTAISLIIGTSVQMPINSSSSSVNAGTTAVYRLNNPGSFSGYSVNDGRRITPLAVVGLTTLQKGWLYELEISGMGVNINVSMVNQPMEITLANLW